MQALFVLPLVFAAVSAGYVGGYARTVIAAPYAEGSTQHHAQDAYGYNYGYADARSQKQEVRTADGVVQGSYSYRAPNGQLIKNDYVADANGFRSSLAPTAPKDFALPAVGYAKTLAYAPAAYAPAATVVRSAYAAPVAYGAGLVAHGAGLVAPAYGGAVVAKSVVAPAAYGVAPGFAYRTNTVGYGQPLAVSSYLGAHNGLVY